MVGQQPAPLEVGAGEVGEQEVRVAQGPNQLPPRPRAPTRVGNRRRDLVEQRREEVVVVAVDEEHVDRRPLQGSCASQAAEAGARDHDSRPAHFAGGLRNRPGPPRRRLAIFSSATPPPVASSNDLGSFCFFLATGSKRSPSLATRLRTCSPSNTSRLRSFPFRHFSTSPHVPRGGTVSRAPS